MLTYTRPDGEDPEESGLALSVTAYALTNHRHDLYSDSDPDAAWQDAVSSESTVTLSESLAADNEVHVTLSTTSTITLWEGASGGGGEGGGEGEGSSEGGGGGITNPITSSSTTTGEYDFPLPAGPVNDYGLTHTGYDREGWLPYHFTYPVETNSEAGAPALDSTYSASTISPSAVVQYGQDPACGRCSSRKERRSRTKLRRRASRSIRMGSTMGPRNRESRELAAGVGAITCARNAQMMHR